MKPNAVDRLFAVLFTLTLTAGLSVVAVLWIGVIRGQL